MTNALALLRLLPTSDSNKDAEILALRHQIMVLKRQLHGDSPGSPQPIRRLATRSASRAAGDQRHVPAASVCGVPEQVREYQYADLLPDDLRQRLDEWDDDEDESRPHYRSDLSLAPGWKVGGYANWLACVTEA
ncbi:hypothetical protein ACIP95_18725 [Micromonospora parva]|uniref:hypothetical protein n=1 Tax=Micromonospora parva TaxID=1464048 RepID=UPI00381B2104